ncbi:MAG: Clp protease ClpP [Corynebacterium glucuronolyticum]|nr:Clp protease ClpP [Corynebacterium glucuronolyticum]
MSKRFWNWSKPPVNEEASDPDAPDVRVLHLDGVIAEETWFDDDITPALFAEELNAGSGDITVWINSPGGDVVAAAQIYNLLTDYPGTVTVRIDGLAASAASVIAMAGETVVMSPVSMLMIHNPATMAMGDSDELGRAIEMLGSVKESIINAYQAKTGMSRAKLAKLMDAETWMDARAALTMGFADQIDPPLQGGETQAEPVVFDRRALERKIVNHYQPLSPPPRVVQPPLVDITPPNLEPDSDCAGPEQTSARGRLLSEAYLSLGQRIN